MPPFDFEFDTFSVSVVLPFMQILSGLDCL